MNKSKKIMIIACNWVLYTGSEYSNDPLEELNKSENINVARVMCVSRINRPLIVKTFQEGYDGLLILSCDPQRCKHKNAISVAKQRVNETQKWLISAGFTKNKLLFREIAKEEIPKISSIVNDFMKDL